MKKQLILLALLILAVSTSFSQTQKGGRYFGGNLRFGSDKTKYDNGNSTQTNRLNARVDIGKFLHDDFAIGAALQMEREASTKGSKSRYFNPQLLGTARYYAGKEKAKIFLAGQLGLSFSHSSNLKFAGTDFEEREGTTQIGGAYGVAAGAAWFLRPGIAVEGMAGWEGHALPKSKSNVSFTGLKIGLTAYLGSSGKKSNPSADTTGKYANYGRKIGIGISIFDGLGVPVRYYLSPKRVLEGGIYFAGIAVTEYEETQLKFAPMLGGGFTFFGDRFEKVRKQKIRAHGLALRLNYLTGDYSTTMLSAGWAMETFKKNRSNRSFIFELGLRGQFPNYEIEGEPAKVSPGLYLRCHWNFFVG